MRGGDYFTKMDTTNLLDISRTKEGRLEILSDKVTLQNLLETVNSAQAAIESIQEQDGDIFNNEDSEELQFNQNSIFELIGDEQDIKDWTITFRILRNLCVECIEGQKFVRELLLSNDKNCILLSCKFVMKALKLGPLIVGNDLNAIKSKKLDLTIQACLQFLSNSVTGNEENQCLVWKLLCEGGGREGGNHVNNEDKSWNLIEMIVQAGKRLDNKRRVLSYVIALVHNCCVGSALNSLKRFEMLVHDKLLISVLLRHAAPPSSSSSIEQETNKDSDQLLDDDLGSEWISLLFENAIAKSMFMDIWQSSGGGKHSTSTSTSSNNHLNEEVSTILIDEDNKNNEEPIVIITSEQLVLLNMVSCYLLTEKNEESKGEGDMIDKSILRIELCVNLVNILRTFPVEQNVSSQCQASSIMHHVLNEEGRSLIIETLSLMITNNDTTHSSPLSTSLPTSLPTSSLLSSSSFNTIQVQLVESGLVEILVNFMIATTPKLLRSPVDHPNGLSASSTDDVSSATMVPEGRRVSLIKLAANLCYECPEAQDRFRETQGGIGALLNQCNIDKEDSRPGSMFLREWGIFAIRNLCTNNPINQGEVDKIVPQKPYQTDSS